ncbi:NUDIX hydrolase [Lactobacillus sp. YT155]|uniref:NUDIX hydrolase n=1 Tax=Lactobacillus sp. YT155 TaxID=3060955 RepID=UPI00265ECF85|nr:NUDIX hydrolase [Lactobacillus sp. YT155]MDO1605278.1 NUDIX hydrolase [Lactobacillus sp. YT155]
MQNKSKFFEKILSEKEIFKGQVVDLSVQTVELPDGQTSTREVIKHNGGVGIILFADNKIALVRQWRAPMELETLEIPAGKINFGETDLKSVAKRELREETGYVAKDFEKVSQFYGSPGFSNEILYLYNAIEPEKAFDELKLDEDEFLNVEWFTIEETQAQIDQGVICDAKTMLAIDYIKLHKGRENG